MFSKQTLMFYSHLILIILLSISSLVVAEDAPSKATTVDDPGISIEALQIVLNPMTKEELFVEADGWLMLLQKAAKRVSFAKLEVLNANNAIKTTEKITDANEKIAEKIEDIQKIKNVEEQEKMKKALQKEVENDLKKEITDLKEEIKANIRSDIKEELQQEIASVSAKNAESETDKAEKTKTDVAEDHKEDILVVLSKLRKERRAIIERLNIVISEINSKIGLDESGIELAEVMPYRRYIDTVGGIKLDLSDSKSTWLSIKGYILSEDGGMKWLINLGIFVGILFIFMVLSRILSNAVRKGLSYTERSSQILNDFFINSVRRLTFIVGILVAISAIGISVAPIMAIIGAAGFVVAFALQGTLSNFASGIMIMLYRPFDVGDLVEVAGIMGKVQSMTLVSTTIMTPDNKLMIVPNNSIWGDVITNAHYSKERRVDMVFGIGYDDDIEKAMQIMTKILADHPAVLENPVSIVQVSELADSSVNFICRPWTKTDNYWTVYWDVTRAVKEQFDAAGVSIPFPQTDVHIHHQSSENNKAQSIPKQINQKTLSDQFNEMDTNQDD